MGPLYAFSLVPVLSISLLLCLSTALRPGKATRGLSLLCASIAAWSLALLLSSLPHTADWGRRFAACGAFLAAGYLHAAYDLIRAQRYLLVWLAYLMAALITAAGIILPGLLYDPINLQAGPMFWPAMALAIIAATVPMWALARAAWRAPTPQRRPFIAMIIAGVICYIGAWTNALLLSMGKALPYGLLLVLASLLVIAKIISHFQPALDRRLLDRSLLLSSLMALLWAAYLFGLLSVIDLQASSLLGQYRLGALFLLAMAALAFEPLRLHLQLRLGGWLFGQQRLHAEQLARALSEQEQRADHLQRQAELGAFTSAIAHEVRNPLGVLQAHMKLLELDGVDEETLAPMRDQIARASHFLDELLSYGRPRPLSIRAVELGPLLELARSSALMGRDALSPLAKIDLEYEPHAPKTLEADQAQLLDLWIILIDNAILATLQAPEPRILIRVSAQTTAHLKLTIEDSGPGIPEAMMARLFEPFVTSRPRSSQIKGTGLGLAIAQRIAKRHGGQLDADRSPRLGGARFTLTLPLSQPLLATATDATDTTSPTTPQDHDDPL